MDSKNFFSKLVNKSKSDEILAKEAREIKIMILLKSLVFGLFIVFITLLVAFFIIRDHHLKKVSNVLKCGVESSFATEDKIDRIEVQNNVITIITEDKSGHNKTIVRLDANCGNEINRINLIAKRK